MRPVNSFGKPNHIQTLDGIAFEFLEHRTHLNPFHIPSAQQQVWAKVRTKGIFAETTDKEIDEKNWG